MQIEELKDRIRNFLRKHTEIEWWRTPINHNSIVRVRIFGMTMGKMTWDAFGGHWENEE